jgi:chromosome partitioning protein
MTSKIIAIANQKGGVGKTTCVLNIGSSLVKKRKKVLVVDLDPQGNATTGSGIDKSSLTNSVYDVLLEHVAIADAIVKSDTNGFDILPANRHLAGAEIELIDLNKREYRLQQALMKVSGQYDIILIDCPPALSLLTINGLTSANYLVVPIQCEYYALEGLTDLLNTVNRLTGGINPQLKVLGLVRTMYDKRNNLALQVSEQLNMHFKQELFKTYIPRNVRLAEAPSFGMSGVVLDRDAIGAKAYLQLTQELVNRLNTK